MKATVEYIKERFAALNRQIFKDRLPDIPVRLTNAKTYAGMICYKRRRNRDLTWHYSDFSMRWSNYHDRSADAIDDVLLHEMIHLLILCNQLTDTAPHGHFFRAVMDKINREWSRHITISERIARTDQETDNRLRDHIVGIVEFSDGTSGIAVPASTCFRQIAALLSRHPSITSVRWFTTRNPYFNRYPHTRTARVFPLPSDLPPLPE